MFYKQEELTGTTILLTYICINLLGFTTSRVTEMEYSNVVGSTLRMQTVYLIYTLVNLHSHCVTLKLALLIFIYIEPSGVKLLIVMRPCMN